MAEGTYDSVTVEEFDRYVSRTFRGFIPGGLRKHRGKTGHQWHYDLWFNTEGTVGVRILSSITVGRESARGAGEGLIKLVPSLFQLKKGDFTETWAWNKVYREFKRTKSREGAKRRQSWRNSLQAQVRKALEEYYEKDQWWDWVGGGKEGPPPERRDGQPYQEVKVQEKDDQGEVQQRVVKVHKGTPHSIDRAPRRPTMQSDSNSSGWGSRLERGVKGEPGDEVITVARGGKRRFQLLVENLGTTQYGEEVWTVSTNPKPSKRASELSVEPPAEEPPSAEVDLDAWKV